MKEYQTYSKIILRVFFIFLFTEYSTCVYLVDYHAGSKYKVNDSSKDYGLKVSYTTAYPKQRYKST